MKVQKAYYGFFAAAATLGLVLFTPNCGSDNAPDDTAAELRYLSFAVRDRPPSVAEARSVIAGEASASELVEEWLDSSAHENRVFRFFNDLFGVSEYIFLLDNVWFLEQTAAGVYYMPIKGSCAAADAVSRPAWFSNEEILMCPSTARANLTYDAGGYQASCLWNPYDNSCGCGPQQLLCIVGDDYYDLRDAIRYEFANRAIWAYRQNLDWETLVGGDRFYGNRYLYWYYLYTLLQEPTAEQINALRSIPLNELREADYPVGPQGSERSGVVTAPGFMKQFNNFRSRIRALTNQLLCQDVNSGLNTSRIDYFVNTRDLDDFNEEHGTKEGCSGCHFYLDNAGTAILGWDDNAFYSTYQFEDGYPTQKGHAFGRTGYGPQFLMERFVHYSPDFYQCAARKTWESFSGEYYNSLDDEEQEQLAGWARLGIREMIRNLLRSELFQSQRTY